MREVIRHVVIVGLVVASTTLSSCNPPNGTSKQVNSHKSEPKRPAFSEMSSLYSASTDDWRKFLTCWRAQMNLPTEGPNAPGTKEVRFTDGFPASYRHFVEATNGAGWILPGDEKRFGDRIPQLLPLKEIGPFRKVASATWSAWNAHRIGRAPSDEVYYNYSNSQDEGKFREAHLDGLLVVGDLGHGTILALNPAELSKDGEMEAWYLSTRLPGALRFRSFAELMQLVYFMDIYPDRDVSQLTDKDFVGTCAQSTFLSYRRV